VKRAIWAKKVVYKTWLQNTAEPYLHSRYAEARKSAALTGKKSKIKYFGHKLDSSYWQVNKFSGKPSGTYWSDESHVPKNGWIDVELLERNSKWILVSVWLNLWPLWLFLYLCKTVDSSKNLLAIKRSATLIGMSATTYWFWWNHRWICWQESWKNDILTLNCLRFLHVAFTG